MLLRFIRIAESTVNRPSIDDSSLFAGYVALLSPSSPIHLITFTLVFLQRLFLIGGSGTHDQSVRAVVGESST